MNQGAIKAFGDESSFSKIARDQSPGPGDGDRTNAQRRVKNSLNDTKNGSSPAKKARTQRNTGGSGGGPKHMNALAQLQKTQSLHYNGVVKLNDATSVMMQDSFLIKNHNSANFDSYYQMMRKRKTGFGGEQQQTRETDSPSPLKMNTRLSDPVPKSEG